MTKSYKDKFHVQGLLLLDALLVWLGFIFAYLLRDPFIDWLNSWGPKIGLMIYKQSLGQFSDLSTILVVLVPCVPLLLEFMGFYNNPFKVSTSRAIGIVCGGIVLAFSGIGLISLFYKMNPTSRALLVIAALLVATLLIVRFIGFKMYMQRRVASEKIKESIVLAGMPEEIEKLYASLSASDRIQWRVVGRYDLASDKWDEFQQLLHDEAVERVIFATKHSEFDKIATAVEMCEVRGIEAWISANFMQTQVARPSFDSIHGNPMLVLRSTPDLSWELLAKGLMDRVGALLAIIFSSPIWLVVAIGIKWQSPGPVFYRQERAGRYGKPFWMWKFRTMIVDADQKLEALKEQSGNQMSGPVFKLENDPRIFPLGHILRKFSIDEFPQFINVLMGDMSLVGPRPMAMYELPKIERSEHRRKLSVKPGLTCIWQVSGRNHITSFDDWVKLDLEYIDNWSLWLDIKLLVMTIPAVLFAKGAK
jgi:exopolysaccharide biosynthesis polyprenyl glycosylphosphotransferase